jgi:hypothetical protein
MSRDIQFLLKTKEWKSRYAIWLGSSYIWQIYYGLHAARNWSVRFQPDSSVRLWPWQAWLAINQGAELDVMGRFRTGRLRELATLRKFLVPKCVDMIGKKGIPLRVRLVCIVVWLWVHAGSDVLILVGNWVIRCESVEIMLNLIPHLSASRSPGVKIALDEPSEVVLWECSAIGGGGSGGRIRLGGHDFLDRTGPKIEIDSGIGCDKAVWWCSFNTIVWCGGPASIVIAWEDIDGAISECLSSGELAYDEGEPADSRLGETVWHRDSSASCSGWFWPVGPLPSGGRDNGCKPKALRRFSFSSCSSSIRRSKAWMC